MKIIPECGNWFYKDGRRTFQIGVGWYRDPNNGWKLRAAFGFWFIGLMFISDDLAPEVRRQMRY